MSKYPGNIITTGADAGYSVAFDGTGDYLSIADNAAFQFAGDFTIEFWIYANNLSATQRVLVKGNAGAADYSIDLNTAGTFSFNNNTVINTSTASIRANTWNHVAVTRSGLSTNNCTWWINGVASNTFTTAQNYNNTSALWFGQNQSTGLNLNGYLSNIRIVKGTALYTAAFTPPTQLLNITNTSLLTCNSPAIVDQGTANSGSGFPITVNGNAAVSTFTPFAGYQAYNPALGAATPGVWSLSDALQAASTRQWNMYDPYFNLTTLKLSGNPGTNVPTWITDASTNNFAVTPVGDARAAGLSPFSLTTYPNSGSGYFDGTGDYLSAPTSTAFNIFGGDMTMECWFYQTSAVNTSQHIFAFVETGTNRESLYLNGTTLTFWTSSSAGSGPRITFAGIAINTWYHVAVVKSGATFTMYVNGTSAGTSTTTQYSTANQLMRIGTYDGSFAGDSFTGYISNARVVKGVAVYTGNFTTPTAPLTATQPAGTNIAAITGTSTSLLTLQNSQSSNNNSFLDSSSNNFLITRNGNTTQGTFTPFTQTGWSNFFNGTTDYINYATGQNIANFGTSDFTIEAWVNPSAVPIGATSGFQIITSPQNGSNVTFYLQFYNSQLQFGVQGSAALIAQSWVPTVGQWVHVAVCRSGTNLRAFINGTQLGTTVTNSSNFVDGVVQIAFGGAGYLNGYISNIRVNKSAIYTANFTPSTSPLTANANTVLLTCQSNRFVDNAGKTLTLAGAPRVQAFSPFNTNVAYTPALQGGSGYFDGTGDYLQIPANAAFQFDGDFTVECWFYSGTSTTTSKYDQIVGTIESATTGYWRLGSEFNGGKQFWFTWTTGAYNDILTSFSVSDNAWHHLAVTRISNSVRLFVDGVQKGATTTVTTNLTASAPLMVMNSTQGTNQTQGYVSSLRIIKGQGLYNGTFTPPTTPFTRTSVGSTGAGAASSITGTVGVLLNFTNAGIVDSTAKNALETVGNAQISTAQSKFGGSSLSFAGATTDALWLASRPYFATGTSDFTIECWVRVNSLSAVNTVCGTRTAVNTTTGWNLAILTNGSAQLYDNTGYANTGASTIAINTWYHIAFVRINNVIYSYINGEQKASTACTRDWTQSTFWVGNTGGSSEPMNGYIGDLRLTRFARYTGAFTPPTSLLQNQ